MKKWSIYLYLLNFALLFTHEIDTAFWKEWDILKGDIEFTLPASLALLVLILIVSLAQGIAAFKDLRAERRAQHVCE